MLGFDRYSLVSWQMGMEKKLCVVLPLGNLLAAIPVGAMQAIFKLGLLEECFLLRKICRFLDLRALVGKRFAAVLLFHL